VNVGVHGGVNGGVNGGVHGGTEKVQQELRHFKDASRFSLGRGCEGAHEGVSGGLHGGLNGGANGFPLALQHRCLGTPRTWRTLRERRKLRE
jgi:hypothetical protein